jgi:NAD(P)-dependent dehydrogenase (short-subunit alcohol dehydrogenase family)
MSVYTLLLKSSCAHFDLFAATCVCYKLTLTAVCVPSHTATTAQAVEAAEHGTRVNAVAPGLVHTNILGPDKTAADWNEMAKEVQLLPRAATPAEVAKFVCFLLSDDASFITGSVEAIDGGAVLKM